MGDRGAAPCKFWVPQLRSGCKFGDRCRYPHPIPSHERCRYFSGPSGCRDGDNCLFTHDSGGGKGKDGGKGGGKGGGKHKKGDHGKGGSVGGRRTEVPEAVRKQLLESFKQLDTDHDGVITKEEIDQVLKLLSPGWRDGDTEMLFVRMDMKKDGKVCFEEFLSFCVSSGDGWDKTRKFIQDSERGAPINVTVSDLAGQEYKLRAKTTWTVARLKLAIYHASDVPPEFQDLGEELDDRDVLGEAKIKDMTGGYYEFQLIDSRSAAGGVVATTAVVVPGGAATSAAGEVVQYRWTEMAVKDMPADFAASLGVLEAGGIIKEAQLKFLKGEGWPADHLVDAGLISKTTVPAATTGGAAAAGAAEAAAADAAGEEVVEYRWTAMAAGGMPADLAEGLGVIKEADVVKDEHFDFLAPKGWPTDHLLEAGLITKHMVAKKPAAGAADCAATEEVTEYKWTAMAAADMPPDFAKELGVVKHGDVASQDQLNFLEGQGWPVDHLCGAGLLEKSIRTVSKPEAKTEEGGFVDDLEDTKPVTAPADKPKDEGPFSLDLF